MIYINDVIFHFVLFLIYDAKYTLIAYWPYALATFQEPSFLRLDSGTFVTGAALSDLLLAYITLTQIHCQDRDTILRLVFKSPQISHSEFPFYLFYIKQIYIHL